MSVRFFAAITLLISATAGFSLCRYLPFFAFTVTPERFFVSAFSVMRICCGVLSLMRILSEW